MVVLGINVVIAFFTFAAADHLSHSRFTPTIVAMCLLASAAPNVYMGTVMRLFKLNISPYFRRMTLTYVAVALAILAGNALLGK